MAQTHTVAEGDTMITIADKYGFGYWETIYYDSQNADLRSKCPDPLYLAPGTSVHIPDKKTKAVSVATNKKHTFTIHKLRQHFRMMLQDEMGKPRAGLEYRLEIGGKSYRAATGADGVIEHEVPGSARDGTLYLIFDEDDPDSVISQHVIIGGLPPLSEVRGIQARLNHLGFDCGIPDGTMNDKTKEAIKAFKREYFEFSNPNEKLDDDMLKVLDAMGGR